MKICVMIPAYNEQSTIGQLIESIPCDLAEKVEVVVVNDGSTDSTEKIAKSSGAYVAAHKRNRGLGFAFRTGIETCLARSADIIVTMDADGQFDTKDITKLIRPIMNGRADMVTCSRFKDKELQPKMPFIKKWGNKRFTNLINNVTGKKFTDTQCGFRAYSRDAAMSLTLFGSHTYTQEVFLDLVRKGFTIEEVACKVKPRAQGSSKVVTSIPKYAMRSLLLVLRTYRDYKPLRFFGTIGLSFFLIGTLLAAFLGIRLFLYHVIYPLMFLVYVALVLIIIGMLLGIVALIADMYARQRDLLEEIIIKQRKIEYNK